MVRRSLPSVIEAAKRGNFAYISDDDPQGWPNSIEIFLRRFAAENKRRIQGFSDGARARLVAHGWPGNVRELENAIERAVLVAKGSEIAVTDLPESIREESATAADFVIPPHRTLAEIEKMAILQTLQRTNWNKQEAAQILGLYRPTLYSKMKKHEIRDGTKSARAASASPPARQ